MSTSLEAWTIGGHLQLLIAARRGNRSRWRLRDVLSAGSAPGNRGGEGNRSAFDPGKDALAHWNARRRYQSRSNEPRVVRRKQRPVGRSLSDSRRWGEGGEGHKVILIAESWRGAWNDEEYRGTRTVKWKNRRKENENKLTPRREPLKRTETCEERMGYQGRPCAFRDHATIRNARRFFELFDGDRLTPEGYGMIDTAAEAGIAAEGHSDGRPSGT